MILLIHVMAALSSLGLGSWAAIRPTSTKLNFCYGLVLATVASGTYLVISRHVQLLSVCLSGLLYLSAVSLSLVVARKRLAAETNI